MDLDFLKYLLIPIIVTVVLGFISRGSQGKVPDNKDGYTVLRPNKIYLFFGYFGILLFGLMVGVGFFLEYNIYQLILVELIAGTFLFGSIWMVVADKRLRVLFNEDEVVFHGAFGKYCKINWSDVSEVIFSPPLLQLCLKSAYCKIPIHKHLIGFGQLLNMMKSKLRLEIYDDAMKRLSKTTGR